jgi:HSP20 family protein
MLRVRRRRDAPSAVELTVQPQEEIMALMKWRSPGEEVARLERRMRRLFEEPFRTDFLTEEMGWMPAVEVADTEKSVEVTAELAGMTPDDVEIHLENNVLTIRGEKKEENEEKEKERYLYERFYGSFQRAFTLPATVEESKVKAEFKNGVLKIHLPKTAESKGKKISIT